MTSKDNIIKGINQAMSAEIDSITYDKPPSDKNSKVLQKNPNLLTVDWENVLPEPPKNSELINLAGRARILQGVHYPSDNDASMVIASVLYEDLKYEMFPDMKIRG
jgi:hypothetical protein